MARLGRRFPVPWRKPRVQGLYAPSLAGVTDTEGAATIVPTYPTAGAGSVSTIGLLAFSTPPAPTSSLPTFDVWIAFNPTQGGATLTTANAQALPPTGQSNAYWTNVSTYLRDFQTSSGKQHFLDRVEAATLRMTVDARLGYFLNSSANPSGFVIQPRLPIAVSGTWSGTTYHAYWGIADTITEKVADVLNVDLLIQASDLTKYLSLMYLTRPNFYSTYANSAAATNWYRCSLDSASTITLPDQISTNNGTYKTTAKSTTTSVTPTFPNYGVLIYDYDTCADMANGTNTPATFVQLPQTSFSGFDFWILGAGLETSTTFQVIMAGAFTDLTPTAYTFVLSAKAGTATCSYTPTAGGATTDISVTGVPLINDGLWHHVGMYVNNGVLFVYQDGVSQFVIVLSASAKYMSANAPGLALAANWVQAAGSSGYYQQSAACYLDEIVVSGQAPSYTSVTPAEFQNRFIAGSLLQRGYPKWTVYSGDRIAEILVLVGYGTISGGAISVAANTFYINGSAYPGYGNSANGYCQVEPYYWDSPTLTSTALDLILQVCDSDIGIFFQAPDGTFQFFDQSYYGTWTWNSTTNTGTWATTYSAPTGSHIWTDDASSSYAYDGPSLQVIRDDADVWTTVRVTPQAGVDQVYEDTAAEPRWGFSTLVKSGTVPPSLNQALSAATYLGYLFRSALPRVGNVELRSETSNGSNNVALLGVKIGDPVTFKRTSPNASTTGTYPSTKGQISADMVVEAIQLDFQADPGYFHAGYVLDPYPVRS